MASWSSVMSVALVGAGEGGGRGVEAAVGFQEVADFAIGHAVAVLEFCGHGEHVGAEGVAGSAGGVGSLLGMTALDAAAERAGLAMRLAARLVELATQVLVVLLESSTTALQTGVVFFQLGDACLQASDVAVARTATAAGPGGGQHGQPRWLCSV